MVFVLGGDGFVALNYLANCWNFISYSYSDVSGNEWKWAVLMDSSVRAIYSLAKVKIPDAFLILLLTVGL